MAKWKPAPPPEKPVPLKEPGVGTKPDSPRPSFKELVVQESPEESPASGPPPGNDG